MIDLQFSEKYTKIRTLDMHTGGEPLRIILDGYPTFENKSILEIQDILKNKYDHLRKSLMWEPRGHADMYGLLKVPPQRKDSDFGVIFMHNEGYSTMCGHATIAIAKAALMLGWVAQTDPLTTIKIDAPCGQLTAYVKRENKVITEISFDNVPSFYVGSYEMTLPSLGYITYVLAYGGAFYAYLDIAQLNLSITTENYSKIIELGKEIKRRVIQENSDIKHPSESDLSFLYGTIFIDQSVTPGIHSRNVCVFADGEVDRCATGSGVSGRAAIEYAKGKLKLGESITIESIIGTTLDVTPLKEMQYYNQNSIIPRVTGDAYFTGYQEFWIDPEDPLKDGFILR